MYIKKHAAFNLATVIHSLVQMWQRWAPLAVNLYFFSNFIECFCYDQSNSATHINGSRIKWYLWLELFLVNNGFVLNRPHSLNFEYTYSKWNTGLHHWILSVLSSPIKRCQRRQGVFHFNSSVIDSRWSHGGN